MSRKKTEIKPIRAERLKIMIENENITQTKFAESIPMSQQSVSNIINCKTALTEETAREILKIYPRYRIEWLLGFDDSMTDADFLSDVVQNMENEASLLHRGLFSFAKLSGFQIDCPSLSGSHSIDEYFQRRKRICTISRDGKSVTFSDKELNDFENELCDYIEFRLLHIMK